MDQAVFKEMEELVIKKLKEYKKINLFIEIEKGRDISLKALMKHIGFQLENSNRFEKIAVVTDKPWFKNLLEVKDLVMKAEVEAFSHENRMEAIRWIAE